MSAARATGMPVLDAQADFRRARRAYAAARMRRWVMRCEGPSRPPTPPALTDVPSGPARLEIVPLARIVGTLDPSRGFDACFRPASEALRHRWERVALAHRQGIALPPISLCRRVDGYYVIDGRHRVSVARALGHRDIDAWVTRTSTAGDEPAAARPGSDAAPVAQEYLSAA